MIDKILFAFVFCMATYTLSGQCTEFENGPYNNLGSAPCTGEYIESEFEVYASEAYIVLGIAVGGEYSFSVCNGTGVGSWVNEFTIIAPSGAIDNFGEGDGDGCTITWIATEPGDYTIIINEADSCGISNMIDNGLPRITTIAGGVECPAPPVFIEGAESFEGGGIPDCWTTVDHDDDGFDWNIYDAQPGFDGDFSIQSESFINGQGIVEPDNYLITPKLELGVGDSLYYVIAPVDPNFPFENYSVLVSTTGVELTDFTDEVFTEVLSAAGWQGRSIDLSAYDNQTIHIAFRHHSSADNFAFVIDAVSLPGAVNCGPNAVSEAGALASVEVFPNPSSGVFNIANYGKTDTYQIRVFDLNGKQVSSEKVILNNGVQHQIDLKDVASGLYTLQFVSSTEAGAIRVMKN